jgi:hypothetical protein
VYKKMHFVVALDVRRALCCVRVREELASAAERATSFVLGRPARRPLLRRPNAKLPAAGRALARARSADLSRDPSDGGRASFQISVSAAAFFPIGSTPSAYTHILIASQCMFASVWHFPDRMSRIFARYVSPQSVLCGDSLYPLSTRPQRCCGTAKLLFANELILRDVIPIGNV